MRSGHSFNKFESTWPRHALYQIWFNGGSGFREKGDNEKGLRH